MSAFFRPPAKRSTAWSRNRSRVVLSASVSPPPCAYLTPSGYLCRWPAVRRTAPTSLNQVQYSNYIHPTKKHSASVASAGGTKKDIRGKETRAKAKITAGAAYTCNTYWGIY
ncbi:lactococcin 972 family bacteriocin [Streptomyces anulatus]|uniref:lactococcin 972 family bacteriocin n=1 Tax=Streptomyces sp. or20 TaxID=1828016 RepID=UPI000BF0D3F5